MKINKVVEPMLALPRVVKRAMALIMDASLCVLTVWVAFYLRLGEWVALSGAEAPAAIVSSVVALPVFAAFGLYRAVFRYVSAQALTAAAQAVFIYGIVYSAIFTAFGVPGIPRTIGLIQPMLLFFAIAGTRALVRFLLGGGYRNLVGRELKRNVLIYGAGSAGRQLAVALTDSREVKAVGFVDDDMNLQNGSVSGLHIWSPEKLPQIIERFSVQEIYLAVPSATRARRNKILDELRQLAVSVRTLPGLLDIARGNVTISDLRPLDPDDLLGRQTIGSDHTLLERDIGDRVVLVTGAGGSIGSELCRQMLGYRPSKMLIVDSSEYALYTIHQELSGINASSGATVEIVPFLTSVCDLDGMRNIFDLWRPHSVYHAAAYKHVPMVEHNVVEGVRNNVFGTWICARLAKEYQAARFVLVSTDKAVRPTNIMGASKRCAELALQAMADGSPSTCFSMVRFGNVLGSSGSVVPLFRKQILNGGPITVTHREVTRFFMTIPEAVQLVLQAGSMAEGGEVFILDMGEPARIYDLAVKIIELSGLKLRDENNPDGDIEIVFTGLRPGEKLYEELLIGDNASATSHPRIMKAHEPSLNLREVQLRFAHLQKLLDVHDVAGVRRLLREIVPGFVPEGNLVDWVFVRRTAELEQSGGKIGAGTVHPLRSGQKD